MAKVNKTEKTKSKADIFKRLATARVNKAITAIESIGKLANLANYTYTKAQRETILSALDNAVENVSSRFANPGASVGGSFKF